MQKAKQLFLTLGLFTIIFASSFTENTPPPADTTNLQDGDSIYVEDPEDTLWNVIVHVEFSVDSNGTIHDVMAEDHYECIKCDSTIMDSLKTQAIKTVEKIGVWENLQHKDIRYEYPVHMIKMHKDIHHDVYHHSDSLKKNLD